VWMLQARSMCLLLFHKNKMSLPLFYALQAYKILEKLDLPPERQKAFDILGDIEDKLGSKEYQRRIEEIKSRLI
jgi:hypothetical protein